MRTRRIKTMAKKKPTQKIKGNAYSGGKMVAGNFGGIPIVLNLKALNLEGEIPLLADHTNTTDKRIGIVKATTDGRTLTVEGEISADNELANNIVAQCEEGMDWQMSVGVSGFKKSDIKFIKAKKTAYINAEWHEGPFFQINGGRLRETSVVAVGADSTTKMRISASLDLVGGSDMGFEAWLEAHGFDVSALTVEQKSKLEASFNAGETPVMEDNSKEQTVEASAELPAVQAGVFAENQAMIQASIAEGAESAVVAERKRTAEIHKICAGEFADIEASAIEDGSDVATVSAKVLEAMRSGRAPAIHAGESSVDSATALEVALCARAGVREDSLIKDYGEQAVEAGMKQGYLSLGKFMEVSAKGEGKAITGDANIDIRAGLTTISAPNTLSNVANKKAMQTFNDIPSVAMQLCTTADLSDFKEANRVRLNDLGELEPIGQDGEIKHGSVSEDTATNQLATYGKMFAITRQMIIDDDMNAFTKIPTAMAAKAKRLIDQLFFRRLMINPNALFHADNKNLMEGGSSAFTPDALSEAIRMFEEQTGPDGHPIAQSPSILLVPSVLKRQASELLNTTQYSATGSTDNVKIANYNSLANEGLTVVSSPYLSNTTYPNASSTAWYLFGNPSIQDTFEIGFLRGRRTPTVESDDTAFNTLGRQFRIFFDVGIREQDHRGVLLSRGV